MPRTDTLKITQNGDGGTIRVPKQIFDLLKTQENLRFTVKLTEEGILYEPHTVEEIAEEAKPEWLKKFEASSQS